MVAIFHDPDAEADRILKTIWASLPGGGSIPVDPGRIATAMGIDVFEAELAPNVSGAIRKVLNRDPVILLNQGDHPNRQRFTCAHEIGHFVLNATKADAFEYIDYRDESASTGSSDQERFANAFAANLLMPRDAVRAWAKDDRTVVELAYRFKVSQEAMVNRLKNLGMKVV